MRRAGVVFIAAALLALAGCKSADTKSGDDKAPGGAVGRSKGRDKDKDKEKEAAGKGPTWLDDVSKWPAAGAGIPKGTGANPKDPKGAAQEYLGGRVLDPAGKPARNIVVRLDEVGGSPIPVDVAVYTNNEGYFQAVGKPGKTYELTAEATTQDGQKLVGVVQTKVPNPTLLIVLRDDLAAGTFPPTPKPSDKVGDNAPPRPPGDGAWAPGGPATGKPPATIGGTADPKPPVGGGVLPPPPDESAFPPSPKIGVKPENVADGKDPKDPTRSPPASIPGPGGPPVPPLPKLPPPGGPGGPSSMGVRAPGKVALVDTLERPWDLDAVKPGSLVLVEFMDTTSGPCREYLPVLKDVQSRYGASGVQVVGVVCDELPQKDRAAVAAKYHRDNGLNYALFVEPGHAGAVRDRFDVAEYPHAVLLTASGKVLWKGHPGDRVKLEAAIKQNLAK